MEWNGNMRVSSAVLCRKQNYVVTRLLPSDQDYYCDWTPSLFMLYIYMYA